MNDIDRLTFGLDIDANVKNTLSENFSHAFDTLKKDYTSEKISNKLQIIFEYEKHYLDLMKEYKEEIKFANTIQEDLRRERAQFFSQSLKEVSESLKESQVDDTVASKWIQELVKSYTESLDICQGLVDVNVIDTIGKLRQEAAKDISSISFTDAP